jgi:probable biosynthetic protein (TIGR04099 family)
MAGVVVLGMPHLCMVGLSETWLLKECGHRHWMLLAEAAGLEVPDFRDPAGNPVYAAFLSVSIREAAFETVREHDRLVFDSRFARISGSRFTSLHRLSVSGRPIGRVVMTSTFVGRVRPCDNHAIARIELPELDSVGSDAELAASAAETAALRSGRWLVHLGFERQKATVLHRFIVDPCPTQDFNGADFLYFASFQAFVDRAEWAFFRRRAPAPTTRSRDIIYRRNMNPGQRMTVTLLQFREPDPRTLAHWYRLEREVDGAVMADAFAIRGAPLSRAR